MKNISIRPTFQKSYSVTPELVETFYGEPDAFMFFCFAANLPDHFKITKKEIRETVLGIGRRRWQHAVKVLQKMGLLTRTYSRDGDKIVGSEYHITDFQNMETKNAEKQETSTSTRGAHFVTPAKCAPIPLKGCGAERGGWGGPKSQTPRTPFESTRPEDHSKAFLNHFPGEHTVQTFDDTKRDRRLVSITHNPDPLNLEYMNDQGAGVFLAINETDGRGRRSENVTKVRAVFADLDGAPLEPVLRYNPHLVVESSPGHYHAYWTVEDLPLDQFRGVQETISQTFDSDPKVKDLPRVMRIPGYYHQKDEPVMAKIVSTIDRPRLTSEEVLALFPPFKAPKVVKHTRPAASGSVRVQGVEQGERNDALVRLVAHMALMGLAESEIRDRAYEFGRSCNPPLTNGKCETVVQWARRIK